jgi:cell division protein FtsN
MKNIVLVTAITLTTFACKNKNTESLNQPLTASEPTKIALPNTPEEVVRTWETQIAQNQYGLAKQISTGKTLETVVSLDSSNSMVASIAYIPKFQQITCKEEGDKATCDCVIDDNIGQLNCTYFLVKTKGQWLLQDANSEPIEAAAKTAVNVNKKPSKPAK